MSPSSSVPERDLCVRRPVAWEDEGVANVHQIKHTHHQADLREEEGGGYHCLGIFTAMKLCYNCELPCVVMYAKYWKLSDLPCVCQCAHERAIYTHSFLYPPCVWQWHCVELFKMLLALCMTVFAIFLLIASLSASGSGTFQLDGGRRIRQRRRDRENIVRIAFSVVLRAFSWLGSSTRRWRCRQ